MAEPAQDILQPPPVDEMAIRKAIDALQHTEDTARKQRLELMALLPKKSGKKRNVRFAFDPTKR